MSRKKQRSGQRLLYGGRPYIPPHRTFALTRSLLCPLERLCDKGLPSAFRRPKGYSSGALPRERHLGSLPLDTGLPYA